MHLTRQYLLGLVVGLTTCLVVLVFAWFTSRAPEATETVVKQTERPQSQSAAPEKRDNAYREQRPVQELESPSTRAQLKLDLKRLHTTEQDLDRVEAALKNAPFNLVWLVWTDLFEEFQSQETKALSSLLNVVGFAIADKLSEQSSESIYEEMYALISSESPPISLRVKLVEILEDSGTAKAMEHLVNLAKAVVNERVNRRVIDAVMEMPYRSTTNLESMGKTLESAWESDVDSPHLGDAIAVSMARTGTYRSVSTLYDVAITSVDDDSGHWQVISARRALTNVRSNEGITVLASGLDNYDFGDPSFEVSGAALSRLGKVEATQALINWARTAPETADEVVEQWVLQIRDGRSWDYIEEVLMMERTHFRSEAVAAAIERAYRKRQALVEDS